MDDPPARAAPRHISWHCACFTVRKASRAATRFYDRMLAPAGIAFGPFSIAGAIMLTGPATVSELAETLALDRTTLTRNLRRIERDGLVRLTPGADRRERVVSLTPAGEDAVRRAMPHWQAAQDRIVETLGRDRWRRLLEDLEAVSALAEADENTI